jgi:hypothetical protein
LRSRSSFAKHLKDECLRKVSRLLEAPNLVAYFDKYFQAVAKGHEKDATSLSTRITNDISLASVPPTTVVIFLQLWPPKSAAPPATLPPVRNLFTNIAAGAASNLDDGGEVIPGPS